MRTALSSKLDFQELFSPVGSASAKTPSPTGPPDDPLYTRLPHRLWY